METATKLMEAANKSPAAKFMSFQITSMAGEHGWTLEARIGALDDEFVRNPNGFIIDDIQSKLETH